MLDEPTDGLDPEQKKEIRDLLALIAESKVILMSTHILEEAESVCRRAIIIRRGRIVADSFLSTLTDDDGRAVFHVQAADSLIIACPMSVSARRILACYRHELRVLFHSPVNVVFLCGFLVAIGLCVFQIGEFFSTDEVSLPCGRCSCPGAA